jgi:hypothetical protein
MFVVEQYQNDVLHYWDGCHIAVRGAGALSSRWTREFEHAVKFSDRESATKVLVSLCDGIGRVAEHSYVAAKR